MIKDGFDPTEMYMRVLELINAVEEVYKKCRSFDMNDFVEYMTEKYKECFKVLPLIT